MTINQADELQSSKESPGQKLPSPPYWSMRVSPLTSGEVDIISIFFSRWVTIIRDDKLLVQGHAANKEQS